MQLSEFWKTFLKASQYTGAVISLVLNSILFLLIVFRSPPNLGNYKYLMIYIVIFQIAYSILDVIAEPTVLSCGPAFLVFRNFKHSIFGRDESFFLIVAYCGYFAFFLILFAIHFIYRYGAADKKFRTKYLTGYKLIALFLAPIVVGISWAAVCYKFFHFNPSTDIIVRNLLLETYDTRMEDLSYLIVLCYRLDKHNEFQPDFDVFIVMACAWSLIVVAVLQPHCLIFSILHSRQMVSMFCVFYFGIKCYRKLTSALATTQLVSNLGKSLQHQLFLALVLQSIIPLLLMYIPAGILYTFPMLNVNAGILGSFVAATLAIYPAIDPLPTMFIVKNFRNTLLCKKQKPKQPTRNAPVEQAPPNTQPAVFTTNLQTHLQTINVY